jgi:hypothetical protein
MRTAAREDLERTKEILRTKESTAGTFEELVMNEEDQHA